MTKQITGRDNYIQAKALLYAMTTIQALPGEKREYSDMLDMCMIVRAIIGPCELARMVYELGVHTELPLNLHFPDASERTLEEASYMLDFQNESNRLSAEMFDAYQPGMSVVELFGVVSAKRLADEAIMRAQSRCTKH